MRLSTRLSLSYIVFLVLLGVLVTGLAGFQFARFVMYTNSLPSPASPGAAEEIAAALAQSGLTGPLPDRWLQDTLAAGGWVQVVDRDGREVAQVAAPANRSRAYTASELAALAASRSPIGSGGWVYGTAPVVGTAGVIGTVVLAAPARGPSAVNAYIPATATAAFFRYFFSGFLMAVVTAILLALLAGFWYARRLARPLVRLSEELKAAAAGDFSRRVATVGNDEFAVLGRTYNHLAEQLQTAERERSRTEQARRDLVANISHDLRTPLTAIQGFSERLVDEATPAEERRRSAEVISAQVGQLDNLLSDLLELSRLQSLPELKKEDVDLAEVAREQVIVLMPQLEQAGMEANVDLPEDLPPVPGDRRLIGRALQNLLVNAVLHSGGARHVGVTAGRSDTGLFVRIADDGQGIPEPDLPVLFQRFYRGTSATSSGHGSGLGLAIVKQIAEGHGGRVTVDTAPGRGAAFTLWLPLSG